MISMLKISNLRSKYLDWRLLEFLLTNICSSFLAILYLFGKSIAISGELPKSRDTHVYSWFFL